MESHYRINVAKKSDQFKYGVHYFAVEVNSSKDAREIYADLVEKFPGCNISVTYWDIKGLEVDYKNDWKVG